MKSHSFAHYLLFAFSLLFLFYTPNASTTGDPWKVLVIIYPDINVTYIDIDGVTKHLVASMPETDQINMLQSFQNLPHRDVVYDYSDTKAEMEAHVVYSTRTLTSLSTVGGPYSYWPGPNDTMPEINQYASSGEYDSVIIFWQASDPQTGQSIPSKGWGWGGWVGPYGMTYATVFNLSFVWPGGACRGEVFLHEWLHGVTSFYMSRGFPFPYEDLHGAEEAGYPQDGNGCWETWLRDYMRGLVYENGQRTALVPETWNTGSITTYNITDWRGEYFNHKNATGIPVVVRNDPTLNFEWYSDSPHDLITQDSFSGKWTNDFQFNDGEYRFDIMKDDGIRVWIDNVLLIDQWQYGREYSSIYTSIDAGIHHVQVEAFEIDGWAAAKVSWVPSDTGSGFCDNFENNTSKDWTWIDPLNDSSSTLTPDGKMQFYTPSGNHDLYLNYNAPRLIQSITGDFAAITEVEIGGQYSYQGGGLLVWQDKNNYVRLELAQNDDPYTTINFIYKVNGQYDHYATHVFGENKTQLRLTRKGRIINASYFQDNMWKSIGSVQFTQQGEVQTGIALINEWQDNPTWAKFSYFDLHWCDGMGQNSVYFPIVLKE